MKKIGKVVCCLMMICLMTASCGSTSSMQNQGGSVDNTVSPDTVPEEPSLVLYGDFITKPGNVEKTWEKNYDSSEWADSTLVTIYAAIAANDENIHMIEEEANHYLHELGKTFQVHFVMPDSQEFQSALIDADIRNRENGTFIDMYMTCDYQAAVEAGEILDLTAYLQSPEGEGLYQYYDGMLWEQLKDEEGRIYGVPNNPIATKRLVYDYIPQVAELLGVDIQNFNGDLTELESFFPGMLEQGVLPIYLAPKDLLMLSYFGLENYGDIFAIRHEGETWEAVNLFDDDRIMYFYELLGNWREAGYVGYNTGMLEELGVSKAEIEKEMKKILRGGSFFELEETDQSSFTCGTIASDGTRVTGAYYVPPVQAYITQDVNSHILVINADTAAPEECMELAMLLKTDDVLKHLLYCGIENYHYMWQDGRIIYEAAGFPIGLGYELDRRFTDEASRERFTREFHDMNQGVSYALSYYRPCDFSGTDLEDSYQACKKIFEENWLVFLGYYGAETKERLAEIKNRLEEAGYLELIESINADR